MDAGSEGSQVLRREEFPRLFSALEDAGYQVVGPTVRDGAIVYDRLHGVDDLPRGWTDRQGPGRYRLERRGDDALFGYNVGPFTWKKFLFPPRERLFTVQREGGSFTVVPEPVEAPLTAFLGVRACELAGLAVTDRVFQGGPVVDPGYAARRSRVLLVAVQCGQAGGNCFCASMRTGPSVSGGADLVLTEVLGPGPHRFLVRAGSPRGAEVLSPLNLPPAPEEDERTVGELLDRTTRSMGREMDPTGLRDLLRETLQHPRWEEVARRCLSCTNCTLVCPTCFCSTHEEVPDLSEEKVERWRRWDSCFNLGFTELHGAPVRASGRSRYRQWLTHKLGTWHDQFGTSGCIGCGRCITWCPVGIDLTEEVAALRVPVAPAGPPGRPP